MAQQEDNPIDTTQAQPPGGIKKKTPGTGAPRSLDPVVRISSSKVRSVAMEWRLSLGATEARFFGRPDHKSPSMTSVMGSGPCRVFSATQWGRVGGARDVSDVDPGCEKDRRL
jgi:hypothetical protein